MSETDYYLIKRGLFYRPNAQGYTSAIQQAGLYTAEDAAARASGSDGAVTAHHKSEFEAHLLTRTITWHPAETAPKDGDWFVAFDGGDRVFKMRFYTWKITPEKGSAFVNGYMRQRVFTHWTRDKVTP